MDQTIVVDRKEMGMTKLEQIQERLEMMEESVAVLDGFDDAIVSIGINHKEGTTHIIYEREKCLQIFVERDGMTYEEAEEFFSYNTERAIPYMGKNCPIIMETLMD